jgi:hypothetical protein
MTQRIALTTRITSIARVTKTRRASLKATIQRIPEFAKRSAIAIS